MITAPAPSKEEKERRFLRFYGGWRSFCRGLPEEPPAGWRLADRNLWLKGWRAASGAFRELRGTPL